jgi:hypothetical protein
MIEGKKAKVESFTIIWKSKNQILWYHNPQTMATTRIATLFIMLQLIKKAAHE